MIKIRKIHPFQIIRNYSRKGLRVIQSAEIDVRYYINGIARKRVIESPPIFVVGCGHSGTSILLAILAEHSKIYAIPFESSLGYKQPHETSRLLKNFDKWTIAEGKSRWIEKTPRHIRCIDKLWELCPEAKILLILRDGRDVACSIQDRTGSLETGIERWVNDNRAGQMFWHHPNVHVLKYEDIIENFEGTIHGVLDFLGETFEPGMQEYYKTPKRWYSQTMSKPSDPFGKQHKQFRNWQINQPLFDGRGKWKRMTDEEKQRFKDLAGEMLIEYGYSTGNDW